MCKFQLLQMSIIHQYPFLFQQNKKRHHMPAWLKAQILVLQSNPFAIVSNQQTSTYYNTPTSSDFSGSFPHMFPVFFFFHSTFEAIPAKIRPEREQIRPDSIVDLQKRAVVLIGLIIIRLNSLDFQPDE